MALHKRPNTKFDAAELRKLQEPLSVYLARVEGGRDMPIQLEPKDGYPPGQGFTYEEAETIPHVALNKGGGGEYRILVTDSAQQKYEWTTWFPPNQFPTKVPTGPVAQAAPAAPAQPWPPAGGPPELSPWLAAQLAASPAVAPVPTPWPRAPMPYYPGYAGFGYAAPPTPVAPPAPSRDHALELQLVTERSARQVDALQAAHNAEMAALKAEIANLARVVSSPAAPAGPSPSEVALREEIRELRAKSETQGMMAMMMQMMAQLTAPKPMDPATQLVIESMRAQAEAQKESARLAAEAQREAARNAMTPKDYVELVEKAKAATGVDTLMPKVTEMYGGAISMMTRAWETINQMQPQGPHPALEMVGQALTGIQEKVGQAIEGNNIVKAGEAQAKQMQIQAEIERARVEQLRIQAEHAAKFGLPQAQPVAAEAPAPTPEVAPAVAAAATSPLAGKNETRAERDVRLFGPLLEKVEEFRTAVREQRDFTPAKAAKSIFTAYSLVQQHGIEAAVPGFALLREMRFSDLVDELLPSAKPAYAEGLLAELQKLSSQYVSYAESPDGRGKVVTLKIPPQAAVEDGREEDDEEDEGDDEEESEELPPAAAKAKRKT